MPASPISFRYRSLLTTRSSKAQQEAWTKLDALDKKRHNIEGLIIQAMKEIEVKTAELSTDLAVVFEGRLKDMGDHQQPQEE